MIFKKKRPKPVYHPVYVNAAQLREWLETVPDETLIKLPDAPRVTPFMTDMYYHELTGIHFS